MSVRVSPEAGCRTHVSSGLTMSVNVIRYLYSALGAVILITSPGY